MSIISSQSSILAHVELVETAAEAGVVDQDVDFGPLCGERVDGVLHGAMVAHVEIDGVDGRCAALHGARGYFGKFACPAGSEQKPCALGCKSERSGCADAGAGPGDEDDLSLKAHDNILTNRKGESS